MQSQPCNASHRQKSVLICAVEKSVGDKRHKLVKQFQTPACASDFFLKFAFLGEDMTVDGLNLYICFVPESTCDYPEMFMQSGYLLCWVEE